MVCLLCGVTPISSFKLLKGVELMELNAVDFVFLAAVAIAAVVVLIHSVEV